VSAEDIRARLGALREAGESLRRRPAAEVIDALAAVLERWRDPDGPERRELERDLPAATGFSPANVKEGLAFGLAPWTGDALREVASRTLARDGDPLLGHDTTAVLLAGSIPMSSLLSLIEPLALRSPVLVKTASRDPITAHLVAHSIGSVDEALGGCVDVVDFAGTDSDSMDAFLEADCVVATGSDETVDTVAARARPPRPVLRHGHRLSVALLGPEALGGASLAEAARGIAVDTTLWDQLGCLSPVAVFVSGDKESCRAVGNAVAESLAALEKQLPRGAVDPYGESLATHERTSAELREAAGQSVGVLAADDGAWTVVIEDGIEMRPMPLHRFLRIHPVPSLAIPSTLARALAPLAPHLAGTAVAGFGDDEALRRQLGGLGATRICRPGQLQCPPLDWPRDGLTPFAALARRG
jgi:hypothetical protein